MEVLASFPWLSLLPPLVAIILCFLTKRVLPSLFLGVFAGALLLTLNLFSAVADTAIIYRDMLSDSWHATIILFDFVIGGLVGMIYLSGGAHGFANMITSGVKTARGGQIAGAGMGCVIFFDDYSNTVIVGNGLRPVADTLKISKEKFSYILDSTAAPVATIALVSTWVGYEVGVIGDALPSTMGINPYTIFLHSIPYRFYSILAILLVFMVTISSRDFGPMLDAEYRARTTGKLMRDGATPLAGGAKLEVLEEAPKRAINMILPIIVLVGVALFGMWWTGGGMEPGKGFVDAISDADSMLALLWGSIAGTIVAIIMYSVQRIANLAQMMDAFISGAKMMVMANLVLISAWSIGAICEKVGTAEFVVNISKGVVTPWVLPALLFAISAFIAFSTGTSWGTMAIVLPIAVPMGIALGVPLHLAVAPVLTGGVWGDHCSPISDTTVMSSTFAGSDHIDHVKTQLPYALLAGGVAFLMFLLMPVKFESPLMLPIVWIVGAFLLYFMLRTLSNRSMKKRNISISDLRKM